MNSSPDPSFAQAMNVTPQADVAIAFDTLIGSTFGCLVNGCLLGLTWPSKELRSKDYICFILYRTFLDFIYTIAMGIFQPWAILTAPADDRSVLCTITGFLENSIGCATIFVEPVLAGNRFLATYYNNLHKKISTTRNIIGTCAGVWLMGIVATVPHLYTKTLGRVTGAFCCIHFEKSSLLVTVLATFSFVVLSHTLVVFFNFKIYKHIHAHQNKKMDSKQRSKLQQDKEMLYFIAVAAIAPMLIQMPAVAGSWVYMYRPDLATDWVLFSVFATFNFTPVVNPLITLCMVKPIRRRLINKIQRLRGIAVTTMTIAPQSSGGAVSGFTRSTKMTKVAAFNLAEVG